MTFLMEAFLGLEKRSGYVILRVDPEEVFFSYGYNSETSKILSSTSKERIPNPFTSTCFRKHCKKITEKRLIKEKSDIFSFYPDRKQSINQFK